ncbi:MAG: threonine/serine exporter family protein [Myxococcales bacterium]|nr:threonine/serine exporter family protein [Myxococcales bacterium]
MTEEERDDAPAGPPSARTRLSAEEVADYLVEVGATLAAYGCPSYRLEDVVKAIAEVEGYTAAPFAMPTGFFVSVASPRHPAPIQRMSRVIDRGVNLGRLAEVDAIFNDVVDKKIAIAEARRRLVALEKRPSGYARWHKWLAIATVGGASGVFFGGGAVEAVAGACAGLCVNAIARLLARRESGSFLVDFFGGLVAALVAGATARFARGSSEVVVLAGVIGLVPGMTLTTGLAELARKSLVSGAARLMDAVVTLLFLVFGIALAVGLGTLVGKAPAVDPARVPLGPHFQAIALLASSAAFAVLFSMPRRYFWAAMASGATGYAVTQVGRHLPPHLGAFAAALGVCLFANLLARWTKRPAQIFQLPGMMLLVPGSFGFLGFGDFLRGDVVAGASKTFQMLLIAGALVVGVLLANLVLPARKLL